MKGSFLSVIVCLIFFMTGQAQVNLVLNPSFEKIDTCPTGYNQVSKASGWGMLKAGGGGSPDLYSSCCTGNNLNCSVPQNAYSFQSPKSGSSYVGITVAAKSAENFREYVQGTLSQDLDSGAIYCVRLYVNLWDVSNASNAHIKTIGAFLDNGKVLTLASHRIAYLDSQQTLVPPQVVNANAQLYDSINWMLIEGYFTATGKEKYITVGNFFIDSLSGIVLLNNPTANWISNYYIDDVSVIDISTPAYAGNDTTIHAGDSVFIGRPPEIGLNENCIWFVGSHPIDTVAGLWVKPDTATTYILQQTICGHVSYDTVAITIGVDTVSSVFSIEGNHRVKLYPNPNNGTMVLEYVLNKGELGIMQLYDVTGKEVAAYELDNTTNRLAISNTTLQNGVYTCRIAVNGITVEARRVVVIK